MLYMKIKKVSQYHQADYPTETDLKKKLIAKSGGILLSTAMIAAALTGCKDDVQTAGDITISPDPSSEISSEIIKKPITSDFPALEGDIHYISEPESFPDEDIASDSDDASQAP